jgi:hypothetical protein
MGVGFMLDLTIVRIIFVLVLAASAGFLQSGLSGWHQHAMASLLCLAAGGAIIFLEIRLDRISLKRLIGAATGP